MDYSVPGSYVLHCLLEFAEIPVHWVRDAVYLIPVFYWEYFFEVGREGLETHKIE